MKILRNNRIVFPLWLVTSALSSRVNHPNMGESKLRRLASNWPCMWFTLGADASEYS
jgi:hypothetical protein